MIRKSFHGLEGSCDNLSQPFGMNFIANFSFSHVIETSGTGHLKARMVS